MPTVYTDLMSDIVDVMVPDRNYIEFNNTLYYAVRRKVNHTLKFEPDTSVEKIIDLLTEMKSYAEAYDEIVFSKPGVYKYAAPWFDHIEEDTREWFGSKGIPLTNDFQEYLKEPQFDKMRNNKLFELLSK